LNILNPDLCQYIIQTNTMNTPVVLITDICSVDIDDILGLILILATHKNIVGVIASHHYSNHRAKITKKILTMLGYGHIRVYAGHGIQFGLEYSDDTRSTFFKENNFFPSLFGYPLGVRKDGERQWYPNFGKAFGDCSEYVVEHKSGADFLTNLLTESVEKVKVICVAPPHDLALIDTHLYPKMDMWCMGGGFEAIGETIACQKIGYNWGICPNIVDIVLKKLAASGTAMTLISSQIVRTLDISVALEIYNKWMNLYETCEVPQITKEIMLEWLKSNRDNKLTAHKLMCDPFTIYCALHPDDFETINVLAKINESFVVTDDCGGKSYIDTLDMLLIEKAIVPNVRMITGVKIDHTNTNIIKAEITSIIEDVLFPYEHQKLYTGSIKITSESDPVDIKNKLIDHLGYDRSHSIRVVEIIGICELFTLEKTIESEKQIWDYLHNLRKLYDHVIVLYGYTGYALNGCYDINCLVGHIADSNIDPNIAFIGNIVDQTLVALESWKAKHSRKVNSFTWFVKSGEMTKFGDDIDITDGICDEMLCFGGGVQSFAQLCNMIIADKPFTCVGDVKNLKDPKDLMADGVNYYRYFDAAEFVNLLMVTKFENIENVCQEYLKMRCLYDPRKGDASSKKMLFDHAIKKLIESK